MLYEDRLPQNTCAVDSFLNSSVLEYSLMCVYMVTRMLLQSHNIPAHLFSQRVVPSNLRCHPHRNLYYIYHIDNRTQKYLPGTNRYEKNAAIMQPFRATLFCATLVHDSADTNH